MSLSSNKKVTFAFLVSVLAATGLLAQAAGGPIANWTVPPYHRSSASGGLTTMADISDGAIFVAVTPCRIIDTRFASGTGHGSPALVAGAIRTFDMNAGPCTGIPEGVAAMSLSIAAIVPPFNGFLTAWPTGSAQPLFSQLNYLAGQVVANAAIVPVDSLDRANFYVNTGPTDIYVDINGYFMDIGGAFNSGLNLQWAGSTSNVFMFVTNSYTGAGGSGTGAIAGIMGATNTNGPSAVKGINLSTSGYNFGVRGEANSTSLDSAGVKGISGYGDPLGDTSDCGPCFAQGVRGVSNTAGLGVIGISRGGTGVVGVKLQTSGTGTLTAGYLGIGGYGVYASGGFGGTGAKYFVEPHATDPSLVIKYIALEGPESGTYFRGKGRFQNGIATIDIPEDFRMVTDRDGLSIQVTPIGEMATVAVQTINLDRIVVRGSRNVEFFYTVNGVRRSFKDHVPIQASQGEYTPEKSGVTLESHQYLTPDQRRVLIQNGSYKPDGTINMETAHRLGWDRVWAERERPTPQPVEPSSP